jgi:hypothetical protein
LVITLALMVLLTLLAVGLLGLASISLRASSRGNSMALARSNARLALMLALGELQKTSGDDRAITAPASMVNANHPHGITGVWKAWDPHELQRERTDSDKKFSRWLVSNKDPGLLIDPSAPVFVDPDSSGGAVMLGKGSLGSRKERKGDEQRIALDAVPIATLGQAGRLAWLVIDESVKSRVDLFHDIKLKTPWTHVASAGAPPQDGVTTLPGWEKFSVRDIDAGKLVTLDTLPLNRLVSDADVSIYDPDVTVFSNSLMTNPVKGGLKKDLSMLSSRGLGAGEKTLRLYKSSGVIADALPSDPYLSLLTNYHQLYKRLGARDGDLRPTPYQVAAKLPAAHNPYDGDPGTHAFAKAIRSPNTEPLLVPSLVRVDIIFSMIARNTYANWMSTFGSDHYVLNMQYLPVVTLHNPYSVPLVFEGMCVSFKNLPVGFNFSVDGQDLSIKLVALNQMYFRLAENDTAGKDFGINLKASTFGSASAFLTLEPGQTKLFGTPKVAPTWTWQDEVNTGLGDTGTKLFDARNNMTASFDMAPTMISPPTGGGAGFIIDWVNPAALATAKGIEMGKGTGMVGLVGTEQIGVKFGPYAPPAGNGAFSIAIDLIKGGKPVKAGAIEIKYGDEARVKEILSNGTSVRFPTARSFPETFPKPGVDPPISVASIFEDKQTQLKDYVKSKQFMIFSIAAKTTQESFIPSKPLLAGNPSTNVAIINLTKGKDPEGGVPLEMVMMPIRTGKAAIEENRVKQEGYFFTGNGALRGTPRATFYEFPVAPAESLAQFRHANLAGSGYMPFVTYTVGESMAHPQIGTAVLRERWSDGSMMLDHTYLANEALWDRYFLSTVADQEGPLFAQSNKKHGMVLTDFFEGRSRLFNARFTPCNQGLQTVPEALKDASPVSPAYQRLAAYLMLAGGFNVNSTSEDAWRAVLASLGDVGIETVLGVDPASPGRYALLRVRRPAEKCIDGAPVPTRQKRWQGYRSLTTTQIDELAKAIVTEIRARGPFLSLADFVNRKVGPEGDTTLKGALQAAIDRTSINNAMEPDGKELAAKDVAANCYKSVMAGIGNTASHAPGFVTQGDVLSSIGSRLTVRADTFRIRGYGEARDPSGRQILAKAWCEAVVQRLPDFVDPSDAAYATYAELNEVNKSFGRRYKIVSFRWLVPSEV